jgi:hypothetical protein
MLPVFSWRVESNGSQRSRAVKYGHESREAWTQDSLLARTSSNLAVSQFSCIYCQCVAQFLLVALRGCQSTKQSWIIHSSCTINIA